VLNNILRMITLKSFALGKTLQTTSDGHSGEEIHEVPMMEQFGFTSVPPKGSNGIAFMPDGYSENAVTAFLDSPQYKPSLIEGEASLYDKFGNSVTLKNNMITVTAVNNLTLIVNGACNLTANSVSITAPTTAINGNLTITGSVTANGSCNFGGTGGQQIARVGDSVLVGSSVGVITSGSSNSRTN
jgi:phage gp45-like